jgi:hypothetical protein
MRPRVITAITLSLIVILTATWFRVFQTPKESVGLVAVAGANEYIEIVPVNIFEDEIDAEGEIEQLSQSDMISRQLMTDYLGLSLAGQATPKNVATLASKYANNILDLSVQPSFDPNETEIVADTEENVRSYAQSTNAIYSKYREQVSKIAVSANQDIEGTMNAISIVYKSITEELRLLSVPASFKEKHVALIKNHLSSSLALFAFVNMKIDPMVAMAGLNTYKINSEKETTLFTDLRLLFATRGISWDIN